MRLLPLRDCRQQLQGIALVAYEVVVDQEQVAAPAQLVVGLGNAGVPAAAAMLSSKARGPTRGMEEIDGPETIRRRVIFLDIDGVLQPPARQTRFKHDLEFDDEERARRILSGLPARPNRALPKYGSVPSGLFGG